MTNPFETLRIQDYVITWLPETVSTNDVARSAEYAHGSIIVADNQTGGRGQRGNSWTSRPSDNLTFSVVAQPHFLQAAKQFTLSEAVSLAIADTLRNYGLAAQIKWPNDIYLSGGKVAGILIENDIMGISISRSVVGIGLNVNQIDFPASLPNPVSMALAAGVEFDRREILTKFCEAFSARYAQMETGDTESLSSDYLSILYKLGTPHAFYLPSGRTFTGTIRGVKPSGELMVEHAVGKIESYMFKEIIF